MRLVLVLFASIALVACAEDASPDVVETVDTERVFTTDALLSRFPADVMGLPQAATSGETDGALGFEVTRATASYTNNIDRPGPTVVLNVLDLGSATMAERMGYGWGVAGGEPDTTFEGYPAKVMPRTQGGKTAVSVMVGDRFLIESSGDAVPMSATEDAVRSLDLDVLSALALDAAQ